MIYIGEADGYTIYFDSKKKDLLKSKKSRLLNNEKTKNNSKYIILTLITLLLVGSFTGFFAKRQLFSGKYNDSILIILLLIWIFEFLFFNYYCSSCFIQGREGSGACNKKKNLAKLLIIVIYGIFSIAEK
ncbi:hypothetical protein PRIP_13044 [Listeria riparia FSL S10-1204]|uniref:Uncharacterized protein n=1 Tax=Listeria riparia FSL S10-1204 TaxID=1265816 RepID=W7D3C1_9LIST|nr:hypothetical protein PRIP_13044 [Listeria riparia FSL S10-1204]